MVAEHSILFPFCFETEGVVEVEDSISDLSLVVMGEELNLSWY